MLLNYIIQTEYSTAWQNCFIKRLWQACRLPEYIDGQLGGFPEGGGINRFHGYIENGRRHIL